MKRLIVNADDFGLSEGCNKGIIAALKKGIVTSASIMATGDEFIAAVNWAVSERAPVGLHLCITYGRPLAGREKTATLVDERGFFKRPDRYMAPDPSEVEAEWRAQIERTLSLGLRPDHLDSHHYMHEALGEEVLAIAARLAGELGVPLRQTAQIGRGYCRRAGILTPDLFAGDFYGENAVPEKLAEILGRPWDGVLELMCHPAVLDDTLCEKSSYADFRERELAVLLSPAARRLVEDNGIELIDFSQLGA